MRAEIASEGLKASPPIAITAVAWMQGLTLTDVVALATLAYIALQCGYLLWKWYREYKRGKS